MSTLIEKLNNYNTKSMTPEGELLTESEKALKLSIDKYKAYRTLYFNNNIDVRLCPKNANTTLKHIFCQLHYNKDIDIDTSQRKLIYKDYLAKDVIEDGEFLFRNDSYRIAVKRDPIERALSSVKYILKIRLNLFNPSIDMIEDVLNNYNFETDFHFLPQTFWMGTPDLYNKVYSIHGLEDMIEYLQDDYIWLGEIKDTYKNISNPKIKVKDLSDLTIARWMSIYKIDYDNGWY